MQPTTQLYGLEISGRYNTNVNLSNLYLHKKKVCQNTNQTKNIVNYKRLSLIIIRYHNSYYHLLYLHKPFSSSRGSEYYAL